jgi:DNA-binding IclR family transcriptional regulator
LHREEGSASIGTHFLQKGMSLPLGVGGGALAILAALTDEEVEWAIEANADICAEKFPSFTPKVLRDLVRMTRDNGFSLNLSMVSRSWALAWS